MGPYQVNPLGDVAMGAAIVHPALGLPDTRLPKRNRLSIALYGFVSPRFTSDRRPSHLSVNYVCRAGPDTIALP